MSPNKHRDEKELKTPKRPASHRPRDSIQTHNRGTQTFGFLQETQNPETQTSENLSASKTSSRSIIPVNAKLDTLEDESSLFAIAMASPEEVQDDPEVITMDIVKSGNKSDYDSIPEKSVEADDLLLLNL